MFRRRVRAAAVAMAVLIGVSACTSSTHPTAARPAATPVSSGTPTPAQSTGASTSAITMCSVGKMSASVDAALTGKVSGRENVVFDLRNKSTSACEFDGYPALLGGKSLVDLKFPHHNGFSHGVTGAGPIPAGGLGRFTATVGASGCTKPKATYSDLGIEMPGVQLLSLKFPKQLAGCPVAVTKIGPVNS
jgi:hypothetical protein